MRAELLNLPQPNWFHHGPQILELLDEHKPMICVELGSNRGCSAIGTARVIQQWGGRLTCVDRWNAHSGNGFVGIEDFASNIQQAGVARFIRIICADTVDAARGWKSKIDYLYVDAGHTYDECTADLEAWWPFVRVGGLIAGDDYDDPYGIPELGVTRAWDEFEKRHGQEFQRTTTQDLVHASRLIWGIKR